MQPTDPAEAAAALFRLLCNPDATVASASTSALDRGAWSAIVAAAQRHGLAPLLFWRLTERPGSTLPDPEDRAVLRNAYLVTLSANLRLRAQLSAIVDVLTARGITPVLLKGAHLAFGVYPDPGARPMCDIDLLFERGAVSEAAAALESLGYAPTATYDLESYMKNLNHLPAYGREGCHFVELHWALLRPEEPYTVDGEGIHLRALPTGVPVAGARVLDPADLLLHLCLHAAAADRLSNGLRQIVDVVETLRSFAANPLLLEARKRATAWGAARCLALTLSLCEALAPGALAPELYRKLNPEPVTGEPLALARALVLKPPEEQRLISPNLARALEAAPATALGRIVAGFFPSREFLATFYGIKPDSPALWLRYPRRWCYLLRRYAVPAVQALGGESRSAGQASRKTDENKLADWLAGGR